MRWLLVISLDVVAFVFVMGKVTCAAGSLMCNAIFMSNYCGLPIQLEPLKSTTLDKILETTSPDTIAAEDRRERKLSWLLSSGARRPLVQLAQLLQSPP